MLIYYLIFLILSIFAYREIHNPKPLNIYYFAFFIILFSIYIGLRNEIGCDWEGLKQFFYRDICNSSKNCLSTIEYLKYKEIGFTSINLLIRNLGGNFYISNYILSLFFVIPLIQFCATFKRPFLAILVSFPYLITVIGLGTIRQSISIAFLTLCINEINKNRLYRHFFYSFISSIFHYTSSIFIFLPLLIQNKMSINLNKIKKVLFLLFLFTFLFVIFNDNYFTQLLETYLYRYHTPVSIKSPLLIWIIIAIPSAILLLNYDKYKKNDINKFWRYYSIIGLSMFLSIFFNSVISLRLLLYFLPIQIYVFSNSPDLKIFKNSPQNAYLGIIAFSFFILTIWLNFANHAYCYIPYENLLLK